MNDERDPLIDAIRAAGEVPPPPDRDGARARAMQAAGRPSRRRVSRGMIALLAAALLAVPATVFAARVTRSDSEQVTRTPVETVDPGAIRETEDAEPSVEPTGSKNDDRSGDDNHTATAGSDDGSKTSTSGDGSSSSGGTEEHSSPSPTPTSDTGGSTSGSDGGSLGGSDGGTSQTPTTDGTPTPTPTETSTAAPAVDGGSSSG